MPRRVYSADYFFLISSIPARKISIRKALTDQETFERETASFEVELSYPDVEGVWQKDGIRVKPNNQWRVSTNGRVHSLTLSNLTLEDTGSIVFSAEGVRTSARLTVRGKSWPRCVEVVLPRPVAMIRKVLNCDYLTYLRLPSICFH